MLVKKIMFPSFVSSFPERRFFDICDVHIALEQVCPNQVEMVNIPVGVP